MLGNGCLACGNQLAGKTPDCICDLLGGETVVSLRMHREGRRLSPVGFPPEECLCPRTLSGREPFKSYWQNAATLTAPSPDLVGAGEENHQSYLLLPCSTRAVRPVRPHGDATAKAEFRASVAVQHFS